MSDDHALRTAREAYARQDWATAREQFCAARATDADLVTDDLAALARCYWWLGQIGDNLRTNEQVHHRLLAAGDVPGAALVALEVGFCELVRGRGGAGAGWLARARRLLADVPDTAAHGHLLAIDTMGALEAGELEAADKLARRVLDLGDRHRDPTVQAQGLFLRGEVTIRRGRVEEGTRFLDEAMLPVQDGVVVPEWAGNLYCRMMQLCYELGDLPRAEHWTAVTEQWCRGLVPATIFTGICRVHRVQLWQVHGDWVRALQEAERAATDLAELDVEVAAEAHYRLGELHRLRGDLDAAEEHYARGHALGRDPLPGQALLHLERGRRRVAATALDAALAASRAPLGRAPLLAARIEVALADDPPGRVQPWVEELAGIAEDHASPGWQAEAGRWHGTALVARGRHAAALPVLRDARARWQRIDAPLEVARIRLELATALDALGDHDTADRERDEAAGVLERLGAWRELERLQARRAGRRTPGGLSPREVEVLAAVAGGGSNRDVAARLHISERTVARHLANVYLKTGVASRTAAVAWARERALI